MLKLKSCPKCKGDLLVDKDVHGWYEQCIQCGYQHSQELPAKANPQDEQPRKETDSSATLSSRGAAAASKKP